MYLHRLEQDGVDPLMWPAPAAPQTSQDGHQQPSTLSATASTAETGTNLAAQEAGAHAEAREKQPGGAGSSGGKTAVVGSTLVPRGAYRRLLCVATDISWEPAAPWTVDKDRRRPSEARSSEKNEKGSAPLEGDTDGGESAPSTGDAFSPCDEGDESFAQRDKGEAGEGLGRAHGGSATTGSEEVLADVRLTFTLPPGSFATMFLREVMKRNDDITWSGGGEIEGGTDAVGADGF